MKKIKYSLIVTVYNVETYLKDCLESLVKQQTKNNYEIIIIDDGSSDNSYEISEKYAYKYNNLRVINQKNGGVSNARNHALRIALGEYIVFVDGDDILSQNALMTFDNYISSNSIDLLSFSYTEFNEDGQYKIMHNMESFFDTADGFLKDFLLKGVLPFPFVWTYVYKNSIIKKNRVYFNESMNVCEDYDFNMKYLGYCSKILCIDIPLYLYRKRENSLTATMDYKKLITNLKCKKKYYDLMQNSRIAENITHDLIRITELNNLSEIAEIKKWYMDNKYIVKNSNKLSFKILQFLMSIFGVYNGSKIYRYLSYIIHNLSCKFQKGS